MILTVSKQKPLAQYIFFSVILNIPDVSRYGRPKHVVVNK
jgi:hypothetical protein